LHPTISIKHYQDTVYKLINQKIKQKKILKAGDLSSVDEVDRSLVPSIVRFTATGLRLQEFHASLSYKPGKYIDFIKTYLNDKQSFLHIIMHTTYAF